MPWLEPFEEEWNLWRFESFRPGWPVPNEQRRFGPFWFPFVGPTVSPVMSRIVTRFDVRGEDEPLYADFTLLTRGGDFALAGDTGLHPDGRRMLCEVTNYPDGGPRFDTPGVEWFFLYTREGFPGRSEIGWLEHFDDPQRPGPVRYDFFRTETIGPGADHVHFAQSIDGGTDWVSDRAWQDCAFHVCTEQRNIPQQPQLVA